MIQFAYIAFCLLLAWYNKHRIALGKPIYHGINGALHLAFWIGAFLLTKKSWFPLAALPFEGRLFFDAALDTMRGLPLNYVAKNPKSIDDKIEKAVFGNNGLLPKIIYLIIAFALNLIYYVLLRHH